MRIKFLLYGLVINAIICLKTSAQNTVNTELLSSTGSLKVFTEYNYFTPPVPFVMNGTTVGGINNTVKLTGSFGSGYQQLYGMQSVVDMNNNFCCYSVIGFVSKVINSSSGTGIYTSGPSIGIHAQGGVRAGLFDGNVHVNGNLSKSAGTFMIDHPQDPENKYLIHSFVESPDMMNVYNGNTQTNSNGKATVSLPSYFESLNIDFRYQLTVIGTFAQAIVSQEIKKNTFEIATDKPNVKVSWQVTGVRNDPYAKQNRIVPELAKEKKEKGKFLNPTLYGKTEKEYIYAYVEPKRDTLINK